MQDVHVSRLLERLKGLREKPTGGWECLCPAHDDQRRSLGVKVAKDGKILVHCGAGCSAEDIVGAVGLDMTALWPPREEEYRPAPARKPRRPQTIAATYDYLDETGVLRFQVVRFDPKGFAQRRPLQGGWVWSLDGGLYRRQGTKWVRCPEGETASNGDVLLEPVRRLLYRLPELEQADADAWVFVPEGEKDVDALRALGLVATCNPQGAGKWQAGFADWLAGRRVCVLPDNDGPGRGHAAQVAASLVGKASVVVTVALPDVPVKGDVSDWLAAGGTAEGLVAMAEAAVAEGPKEEQQAPRRTAWLADLARAGAEVRWLWKGWIQCGVLTALAAEGGTGKTRFCADLLRRIRHGLPWPDGQPMELPRDSVALWVVADNHHDEMVSLARAFGIEDAIAINSWADDPYGGVALDSEDDLRDLEQRIIEVKPVMVVVDTVGNATDRNLSRQEDAKAFYQPLQVLARRHGTVMMALTHLNAAGKFLGRRVLEKVRVAIRMEKPDPKDPRRALSVPKTNSQVPPSLGVTMGDGGNEYDDHPPTEPDPAEAAGSASLPAKRGRPPKEIQAASDWLKAQLADGPKRVGITLSAAEPLGWSVGTMYNAARAMGVKEYESEGRKWWELAPDEEAI